MRRSSHNRTHLVITGYLLELQYQNLAIHKLKERGYACYRLSRLSSIVHNRRGTGNRNTVPAKLTLLNCKILYAIKRYDQQYLDNTHWLNTRCFGNRFAKSSQDLMIDSSELSCSSCKWMKIRHRLLKDK